MVRPRAEDVLRAWERGVAENSVDRGLTLLSLASREPRESLAALPIGARDSELLALHEKLFGPTLYGFAECSRCAAPLEFTVSARDLAGSPDPVRSTLELSAGALRGRLKLPDSTDLSAAQECKDADVARRRLCERCVVDLFRNGVAVSASDLFPDEIEDVASAIAAADVDADRVLSLRCDECRHRSDVVFDMAAFLWAEVNALARRLLYEVHVLAWSYGWREGDILAMSDARRRLYLAMVQ
jgi:hypothetical protein